MRTRELIRVGREYQPADPKLLITMTDHRRQLREIIEQAKTRPCTDCKNSFPPCVMHFDHIDPSEKLFSISEAQTLLCGFDVLHAEISKCEVVCANCHAIRTAKQRATGVLPKFHGRR